MASYSTGSELNRKATDGQVAAHPDNFGISSATPPGHTNNNLNDNTIGHGNPTEKERDISVEKANTLETTDVEKSAIPATSEIVYDDDGEEHYNRPAKTAKDLVTEVIHVRDDPTLNAWTFRVWFLGKQLHQAPEN